MNLVERAARNNALWCDAICRAHGHPGEFQGALWLTRTGTARFYPDAVTLTGSRAGSEQIRALSALTGHPREAGWSVKDSFSSLDLEGLGFQPLFDAQWICLSPGPANLKGLPAGYGTADMGSEQELADWEHAWSGESEHGERLFLPSLLEDPHILFVAIRRDNRTVGGGVLSAGAGVVGLTNLFAREIEPEFVWQALVARAADAFPGLPLVGYEQEPDLAPARRAGFRTIGTLRVWLRS